MNETTARNRLGTTESFPESGTAPGNGADHSTVAALVSGIVADVQELVRQQIQMLRAEIKEDMDRSKSVAKCMAGAAVLLGIGGLFLLTGVPYMLHYYFSDTLPLWACWMIVGGVLAVGGLIAFFAGQRILNTYNPLPDKTMNALQENVQCLTNPQS